MTPCGLVTDNSKVHTSSIFTTDMIGFYPNVTAIFVKWFKWTSPHPCPHYGSSRLVLKVQCPASSWPATRCQNPDDQNRKSTNFINITEPAFIDLKHLVKSASWWKDDKEAINITSTAAENTVTQLEGLSPRLTFVDVCVCARVCTCMVVEWRGGGGG